MKISVNGKTKILQVDTANILDLLRINGVEDVSCVSVQHNREFVAPHEYSHVVLKDNDELDFMYFVGGGTCGNIERKTWWGNLVKICS